MISFPPCKINLGLNVISKRSDGYHEIETCFYPVPYSDVLEVIPSDELSFTTSGLSIPGSADDNLCLKAYRLLKKDFNLKPVKIHLHKILPAGAGLGGGSSDAAHTLRLLNQVCDLKMGTEQLKNYASQLGSDCAFFIDDKPMIGSGRGEVLTEIRINLAGKFIVLVHPSIHISTAEAYSGIIPTPHGRKVGAVITTVDIKKWRDVLINDFEVTVFKNHPSISEVKENLYQRGAIYAAMSGSGSTVFGIFDQPVDLINQFPGMKYWSGPL